MMISEKIDFLTISISIICLIHINIYIYNINIFRNIELMTIVAIFVAPLFKICTQSLGYRKSIIIMSH